jgi:hypothetical protein
VTPLWSPLEKGGGIPAAILYRVRQFTRALGASVQPQEMHLLEGYLTPAQGELFRSMSPQDQRHGLDVFFTLQREGYSEGALLQAALLHDVGKRGGGLRLGHRVAIVLMRALWPELLARLARDEPGSWRYPFFVHLHHAARGAKLAQAAGCLPLAVELIRRHQEPLPVAWQGTREGQLLAALQAADGDH